jgi:uncharacterized protein YbaA (DUF1428 family)
MPYVDGFVIPMPKKSMPAYKKMAMVACKVWMDHGALAYYECVGEDLKPKFGVPFPKLAKAKAGETVVFAWIMFKTRKHRDAVNAKVMKDPRILESCDPKKMPFDVKRMSYGGFETLVSASG